MRPDQDIEACVIAHHQLETHVRSLSESMMREPSSLPAWSRAHVVAHLARNAESQVHLFHGPRQGAVHHQYPSRESREADIARTSELSFEQLCAEMSHSMRALEEAWNELGTHDWDALAQTFQGPVTLRECVFRRLREVEVHHVDLDIGFGPEQWSTRYVEGELERSLATLAERTTPTALVMWMIGRAPAPSLGAW